MNIQSLPQSNLTVYQQKAVNTRKRRAPSRKAARELLKSLNLSSRRLAAPAQIDADAELADLIEGREDEQFFARGQW